MARVWSAAKQRLGTLCLSQVQEASILHLSQHNLFLYVRPEPHILLFRRPLGTDPVSGDVDPELEREAKERYNQELALNQM